MTSVSLLLILIALPTTATAPPTGVVFYHSDHLGSSTVLTDEQGRDTLTLTSCSRIVLV